MTGIGVPCEGPSSGRCSLVQQQACGCHPVTARVKWNKEVNKVVIQCFTEVNRLMRKENLLCDTERDVYRLKR